MDIARIVVGILLQGTWPVSIKNCAKTPHPRLVNYTKD